MELDRAPISWPEKLAYLTWTFLKEEQREAPLTHTFRDGWYTREMFIPKETLFIGRPHRHGHRCELVSGKVLHITEESKRIVTAPFEMTTVPGYQTVLFTMTDVIGRTYHPDSGERDIEMLEREIFHPLDEMRHLGRAIEQKLLEVA